MQNNEQKLFDELSPLKKWFFITTVLYFFSPIFGLFPAIYVYLSVKKIHTKYLSIDLAHQAKKHAGYVLLICSITTGLFVFFVAFEETIPSFYMACLIGGFIGLIYRTIQFNRVINKHGRHLNP